MFRNAIITCFNRSVADLDKLLIQKFRPYIWVYANTIDS
jgi:hypothetical protein